MAGLWFHRNGNGREGAGHANGPVLPDALQGKMARELPRAVLEAARAAVDSCVQRCGNREEVLTLTPEETVRTSIRRIASGQTPAAEELKYLRTMFRDTAELLRELKSQFTEALSARDEPRQACVLGLFTALEEREAVRLMVDSPWTGRHLLLQKRQAFNFLNNSAEDEFINFIKLCAIENCVLEAPQIKTIAASLRAVAHERKIPEFKLVDAALEGHCILRENTGDEAFKRASHFGLKLAHALAHSGADDSAKNLIHVHRTCLDYAPLCSGEIESVRRGVVRDLDDAYRDTRTLLTNKIDTQGELHDAQRAAAVNDLASLQQAVSADRLLYLLNHQHPAVRLQYSYICLRSGRMAPMLHEVEKYVGAQLARGNVRPLAAVMWYAGRGPRGGALLENVLSRHLLDDKQCRALLAEFRGYLALERVNDEVPGNARFSHFREALVDQPLSVLSIRRPSTEPVMRNNACSLLEIAGQLEDDFLENALRVVVARTEKRADTALLGLVRVADLPFATFPFTPEDRKRFNLNAPAWQEGVAGVSGEVLICARRCAMQAFDRESYRRKAMQAYEQIDQKRDGVEDVLSGRITPRRYIESLRKTYGGLREGALFYDCLLCVCDKMLDYQVTQATADIAHAVQDANQAAFAYQMKLRLSHPRVEPEKDHLDTVQAIKLLTQLDISHFYDVCTALPCHFSNTDVLDSRLIAERLVAIAAQRGMGADLLAREIAAGNTDRAVETRDRAHRFCRTILGVSGEYGGDVLKFLYLDSPDLLNARETGVLLAAYFAGEAYPCFKSVAMNSGYEYEFRADALRKALQINPLTGDEVLASFIDQGSDDVLRVIALRQAAASPEELARVLSKIRLDRAKIDGCDGSFQAVAELPSPGPATPANLCGILEQIGAGELLRWAVVSEDETLRANSALLIIYYMDKQRPHALDTEFARSLAGFIPPAGAPFAEGRTERIQAARALVFQAAGLASEPFGF